MKFASNRILLITIIILSIFTIASLNFQIEESGNLELGAQLYNSWDWILNYNKEISKHPLWSGNDIYEIETWRCSSCHGWDYKGDIDEGYPGLFSAINMSNEEILEWLDGTKNSDHDYSEYFTVAALRDITAFLHFGIIDYSEIVDEKGLNLFDSNRTYGEELYKNECIFCHETDGSKINFGSASNPRFIGDLANELPEKLLHVVRFGHLEIQTETERSLGWELEDSASLVGYTKYLPMGSQDGIRLLDNIDYSSQGDTTNIVYLSIALVLIIFSAITFNYFKEKRKNN